MNKAAGSRATLQAALLDYYGAPGKYQLTLRQPDVLFSSVRDVLQIASGRSPAPAQDAERLREAAAFFIRVALLFPGADHYALLGLRHDEALVDIKERYRLLMRLIHPDFAPAGTTWPADAAVRVNRAYEVLSSPVQRRAYDDQLAALRAQRPATPRPAPSQSADAMRRLAFQTPLWRRRAAWALGIASAVFAGLLLMPRQEQTHLVQRAPAPGQLQSTPQPPPQPQPPQLLEERQPTFPAAAPTRTAEAAPARALAVATPMPTAPARPLPAAQDLPAVVRVPLPDSSAAASRRSGAAALPPPAAPGSTAAGPVQPAVSGKPTAPALATPQPPPQALPALATAATHPAPTPASGELVAAKVPMTPSVPLAAAPSLNDAQALLGQMLQTLEAGSGDQLLLLLDADSRQQPSAQALSRRYDQVVAGARPVRLSQVEFKSEARGGTLLVTGTMRVHAGEPTIGMAGDKLLLHAEFAQKGGKVHLTGLGGTME